LDGAITTASSDLPITGLVTDMTSSKSWLAGHLALSMKLILPCASTHLNTVAAWAKPLITDSARAKIESCMVKNPFIEH
jgi:hypothetical protein